MKSFKSFLMLMVLCLSVFALSACGSSKKEPAAPDEEETIIIGDDFESEPQEDDSTEAEEEEYPESDEDASAEGYVRSQLTNLWIPEDVSDVRPIAYMCPDDPSALPHYSISKAGVIYELPVEGSISRLLCVIDDWSDLERIGNVRSARHYYVPLAYEWDALFIHFGNPFYADDILASKETDNLNGDIVTYRTKDRSAPQNAYASTEKIEAAISKLGYSRTYTDFYQPGHYVFAGESSPNTLESYSSAKTADKVNLAGCYPVDKPYFEYNEEEGVYYRFQYNNPHVDAAFDKKQLSFSNILIQKAKVTKLDPKGYLDIAVTSPEKKDGYFITMGKAIHVTWKKTGYHAPTKYYDDNGSEIVLNTGKTMVCIISDDGKEPVFE